MVCTLLQFLLPPSMSQAAAKEILYTVLRHLYVGEPIKVSSKILLHILYCTENPSYVSPEIKLCGLILNSCIHVSVSDLYISRIVLSIWLHHTVILLRLSLCLIWHLHHHGCNWDTCWNCVHPSVLFDSTWVTVQNTKKLKISAGLNTRTLPLSYLCLHVTVCCLLWIWRGGGGWGWEWVPVYTLQPSRKFLNHPYAPHFLYMYVKWFWFFM